MLSQRRRIKSLKKTQFVAFKTLDYYDELVEKLKSTTPVSSIAAWVQTIKGDFTDKSRGSIQKQLERMKRQLAPKDVVDRALIVAKEQELGEMIGIVKESQFLMKLNKKRIIRNEKIEKVSPISLPNQDKAIQIHAELIGLNKEILADLGLLTRNKDMPEAGVNVNLNMNVNGLEDDDKIDEYVKSIKSRLARVDSIRKGIRSVGEDGGEGVPVGETSVPDSSSDDEGVH